MKADLVRIAAMPAVLLGAYTAIAHETPYDVAYVETPPEAVELMLDVASVGPGDFVIDLGTGDGRIAIAAAKRGARALGVEIDPELVERARANVLAAGVADQVDIVQQDLFETDLSQASVVAMFLNEEVNLRLRPRLREVLEPGTRVVSHNFGMGDWRPDRQVPFLHEQNGNVFLHDVYLWVIPE